MRQPLPANSPTSVSESPPQLAPDPARVASAARPIGSTSERRPRSSTLVVLAVIAGFAAVGLGAWALVAERDDSRDTAAARSQALDRAAAVLADPQAQRIPVSGSVGRIVLFVAKRGDAVLMLKGLGVAPAGRTYQAWVTIPGSGETLSAGTFNGAEPFVPLTQWVTPGGRLSVTLEDDAGATKPSRVARLKAVRRLAS